MKVVYLILYLFHDRGPAISIAPMPSIAVCESVGAEAKRFADERPNGPRALPDWAYRGDRLAVYRCIEVPK